MPAVPGGSDEVVIAKGGGLMVSVRAAVVEVVALSVTLTVKILDAAVVGVPDMVPPAARVNPTGSVPLATDHE